MNMKDTEKQKNSKDETVIKETVSVKEKFIKFDFNPIEVKVKRYNLRFPIDGMF